MVQLDSWTLLREPPFLPEYSVWPDLGSVCIVPYLFPLCYKGFHSPPEKVSGLLELPPNKLDVPWLFLALHDSRTDLICS